MCALHVRVVVVDDDESIRLTLRRAIAKDPVLVVVGEAADGLTAIEVILQTRPDVVLMDVTMPVMSGVEAAQRLRDGRVGTPIVFLSGDVAACESVGGMGSATFLLKATQGVRQILDAVRDAAAPPPPHRAPRVRRPAST